MKILQQTAQPWTHGQNDKHQQSPSQSPKKKKNCCALGATITLMESARCTHMYIQICICMCVLYMYIKHAPSSSFGSSGPAYANLMEFVVEIEEYLKMKHRFLVNLKRYREMIIYGNCINSY